MDQAFWRRSYLGSGSVFHLPEPSAEEREAARRRRADRAPPRTRALEAAHWLRLMIDRNRSADQLEPNGKYARERETSAGYSKRTQTRTRSRNGLHAGAENEFSPRSSRLREQRRRESVARQKMLITAFTRQSFKTPDSGSKVSQSPECRDLRECRGRNSLSLLPPR